MFTESLMPSNHLILCRPLLLLPSIFPSIRVFSNVSALHVRWPKFWSFSISISPSNEYSGLISFRIDWFDLLAIQRTLKSPLQHHSSKAVHRSLLSINHTWIMCFIILTKCNYFFQMLHFYFLVFTHLSACICICLGIELSKWRIFKLLIWLTFYLNYSLFVISSFQQF